jgi:hypothetical protein
VGAFLSGGPLLPIGATVTMLLQLEGESPVSIMGKVVRHGPWLGEPSTLGVVFLSISTDARNRIDQAVLEAGQCASRQGHAG